MISLFSRGPIGDDRHKEYLRKDDCARREQALFRWNRGQMYACIHDSCTASDTCTQREMRNTR